MAANFVLQAKNLAGYVQENAVPAATYTVEKTGDAAVYAKDAAAPVVGAAAQQTKNLAGYTQENAVPAANCAAEKTQNAAAYTRDAAASGVSSASEQARGLTTNSRESVPTGGALDTVRIHCSSFLSSQADHLILHRPTPPPHMQRMRL